MTWTIPPNNVNTAKIMVLDTSNALFVPASGATG